MPEGKTVKNTPEYLFGQIIARLDEGDKVLKELGQQVKVCHDAILKLPCGAHEDRIIECEDWQEQHNSRLHNEQQASKAAGLSFKHGVFIALISAGVGGVIAGITIVFTS